MDIKKSIKNILKEMAVPLPVRRRHGEFDRIFKHYRDSFINHPYKTFNSCWNTLLEVTMETLYHALFSKTVSDDDWEESAEYIENYLIKEYLEKTKQMWEKKHHKKLNEQEESKQERKFTKLLNNIEEYLNSNEYPSVVRLMVDYDEVMDDVIVNIFIDAEHAVKLGGGINSVIKKSGKKIMEDLSVFPLDFKYHIHFEKPKLNESQEDDWYQKEDWYQKIVKGVQLINTLMKSLYPNFNKDNAVIKYKSSNAGRDVILFDDSETNYHYCTYWIEEREISLNRELYDTLENYLGEDEMEYIIEWFNNEFNQQAEYVTF